MSKKGFTHEDVPSQKGKTALVTGANTGIGFHAAKVLAGQGARVLLGCRNLSKAQDAVDAILAEHPEADVEIVELDLGDLSSVEKAAQRVSQEPRLDLLVNNAGIMMPPYQTTEDGFESQFGVNHLGPFALTAQLVDKLEQTPGARIVNTSSLAHRQGKVDFDNLNAQKGYSALGQYALSKLANLLHTHELQRRLEDAGKNTIAVSVHPGASDTELSRHMPSFVRSMLMPLTRPLLNTAAQGAWPTLMGATAPGVRGGQYFGPAGFMEMTGPGKEVESNKKSHDPELAARLWEVSADLTGVDLPF